MFNASVLKRVSALFVISFLAAASAHATGWQQNGNNTYYSDGNVGIGTTNPTATLDLQSSTNSSWAAQIQNMGTTGAHGLYVNIGASSTGIPFRVDKNGSPLLQVINNGNVGIGTTNPTQALCVNGKIVAKDVQVTQAGWSDFVFAPNYRLMPLNVLEKKIEQSGHLPGIPNSKQVQKDGVSVGEMQGKLLQKVEELTLYVIQQQKEIDTLKKEIKNNKK